MLKTIYIKDYILLDELSIDLCDGLNVITGETGAGKSILINAVDIALGAKSGKDVIKTGKNKAVIEITLLNYKHLLNNFFEENGIDNLGNELVISKEITQSGSRLRVNGTLVSQEFIKVLREKFIDIHSQHQTYSLMQQKNHITLLDAYSKDMTQNKITEYKKLYSDYLSLKKQLDNAKQNCETTESQADFLKFQITEIEDAQITDKNEDVKIKSELAVLENSEKLKEITGGVYWNLSNDDESIITALSKIKYEFTKAVQLDSSLTDMEQEFTNSVELLKDISSRLRDYSQNLDNDTERLNSLQERLFLLDKLKRKYGGTIEAVLLNYEKLSNELSLIENSANNVELLEFELKETEQKLKTLSSEISETRKNYAKVLSALIVEKLEKLELSKSKFEINIEPCELNENGADRVEFLISTNVSEGLKPLSKVASGGEISRVMLAVKSVFANADDIGTIIFDEIDTGISGKTSQSVADEIAELSKYRQIILITHQPIIASRADRHIHVSKTQNETTTIDIKILTEQQKITALAELASGMTDDISIDFAKTLLQK